MTKHQELKKISKICNSISNRYSDSLGDGKIIYDHDQRFMVKKVHMLNVPSAPLFQIYSVEYQIEEALRWMVDKKSIVCHGHYFNSNTPVSIYINDHTQLG